MKLRNVLLAALLLNILVSPAYLAIYVSSPTVKIFATVWMLFWSVVGGSILLFEATEKSNKKEGDVRDVALMRIR